jgi:hypothetical protein
MYSPTGCCVSIVCRHRCWFSRAAAQLELEAKRRGARERLEAARAEARQRVVADVAARQDQADK